MKSRRMLNIRSAVADDATEIAQFWNPIIRETLVTFASDEKTPEMVADMIATRPFFVALENNHILGFATYGQFRGGNGYRKAMEHTIILAPASRGKGVGRTLMSTIEADARGKGYHTMIAGIAADNPDGIAFHDAIGYAEIARVPSVGHKFGKWLDLVLMQKFL